MLLYAVMQLFNADGSQASRQYSFWRVKVDDGTAVAVVPWTTNLGVSTSISNMVVLGASLKHVFWKFTAGGQTTIALTDTVNGTSKTLVQCPTGSGPDTTFLARQWELMRPDVLFLLDDADPAVRNKFISGWQTTTPTLDPVHPALNPTVVEEGALIALPSNVVPLQNIDFASDPIVPATHVINVDQQLTPPDP